MFYPALREPAFSTSGQALLGPVGQDASALIAGLKVGANLAGMQQTLSYSTTFHNSTRLGTRDAYTGMMPGHPTFGFRGSAGFNVGNSGFEEFIAVNQVGKRFFINSCFEIGWVEQIHDQFSCFWVQIVILVWRR